MRSTYARPAPPAARLVARAHDVSDRFVDGTFAGTSGRRRGSRLRQDVRVVDVVRRAALAEEMCARRLGTRRAKGRSLRRAALAAGHGEAAASPRAA
jgi:hypothetical protein